MYEDKLILIYKKFIELIIPEHENEERVLLNERKYDIDERSKQDENETMFDANVIKDAQFIHNGCTYPQIVLAQGNKITILDAKTLESKLELNHNPGKLENYIYKMAQSWCRRLLVVYDRDKVGVWDTATWVEIFTWRYFTNSHLPCKLWQMTSDMFMFLPSMANFKNEHLTIMNFIDNRHISGLKGQALAAV
jgi:hypothetical protein